MQVYECKRFGQQDGEGRLFVTRWQAILHGRNAHWRYEYDFVVVEGDMAAPPSLGRFYAFRIWWYLFWLGFQYPTDPAMTDTGPTITLPQTTYESQ